MTKTGLALLERRTPWLVLLLGSLAVHGALGAGLVAVRPPPEEKKVIVPVNVVVKEEPPPPPPPPPPEEEKPEPPPPPPEPEVPREPVVQEEPPPPPKKKPAKPKKRAEKPKPPPPPNQPPPPPDQPKPPPPPPLMGLNLEGVATAGPGQGGIAVPEGGQRDGERYGAAGGTGERKRRPQPAGGSDAEEPGEAPVPVSGVTSLPRVTREVKPVYPPEIKRQGVEGRVVVALEIGADGRVRSAKLVEKLHPVLDQEALKAARKLRFAPAKVGDTPVAVRIPYTFHFVIE